MLWPRRLELYFKNLQGEKKIEKAKTNKNTMVWTSPRARELMKVDAGLHIPYPFISWTNPVRPIYM